MRNGSVKLAVHPLVVVQLVIVNQTSQEHSSEERYDDTDNPGSGETTDRTCTCNQQDNTCDQRSQVRVEDGRESVTITCGNSLLHTLTRTKLFLDTFINKHVGIHRSTQRKHHTGETWQRQGCLERRQNTKREEYIDEQCQVSHHTRYNVVHNNHVNHQEYESHNE